MNKLLAEALEAHGGVDRWNELTMLRSTIVSGGELFVAKGVPQDPAPREMTVWLHEEHASVRPFGAPDQKTASHSTHQEFYFGPDRLLRRHDYGLDVAGGSVFAHYVYDTVQVDGIRLPTKRRAYLRDAENRPILDRTWVSIDISDIRVS